MGNEDIIKETDEYSEETHSDDEEEHLRGRGRNKYGRHRAESSAKKSRTSDSENGQKNNLQNELLDWKKRIANVLYNRVPGIENAETLMQKIQDIQTIVHSYFALYGFSIVE